MPSALGVDDQAAVFFAVVAVGAVIVVFAVFVIRRVGDKAGEAFGPNGLEFEETREDRFYGFGRDGSEGKRIDEDDLLEVPM